MMRAFIFALMLLASPAWGHDWYSNLCCHDKDCRPAWDGEVIFTPAGWYVKSSKETFVVGSKIIQHSLDRRIHVCQYRDSNTTMLKTRCLYLPDTDS